METTSTQLEQMSALLYLSSPALPIGAFAYSQGLESAIETGHVTDEQSLFKWVETVIAEGLLKLDIPLFNRAYRHVIESDYRALNACNAEVFAARESFELYEEERLLGSALMRLLRT
ncbi:MAG: urease accessory UreF family protein, partial [Oleiphilaceae bacterium]|nr:urease accessory UreF family protein [Oleiphilaceae bacterium]